MREVRRAIDGIDDPAVACRRPARIRRTEFLTEDVVIGIPLGHQSPAHALDREIDFRDQIDDALLPHGERAAERIELHAAGARCGVYGHGEERRGRGRRG
jgi:hypothetical protein